MKSQKEEIYFRFYIFFTHLLVNLNKYIILGIFTYKNIFNYCLIVNNSNTLMHLM